jgi:transcriptional regulator with XRE-family HTH domain
MHGSGIAAEIRHRRNRGGRHNEKLSATIAILTAVRRRDDGRENPPPPAPLIVTKNRPNSAQRRSPRGRNRALSLPQEGKMSPAEFRAWRKSHGLKQKEAAEKLGLKKRMIQYYETGSRGGKKVVIPKTVELACYALSMGVEAFDGAAPGAEPAADEGEPGFAHLVGLERQRDAA